MSKIIYISDKRTNEHASPFPKPNLESFDRPIRTEMIERYLEERGVFKRVPRITPRKASKEDVLVVHTPYVYDSVRLMSELGSGQLGEAAYASPTLLRDALSAVGGAITGIEKVTKGDAKYALSIMRPPGHHASTSTPSGLCYFNNAAIAVKYAVNNLGVRRVSIIDIDDHFGNGTSEIFYADPDVQFISIHEYDYVNFGTGHFEEMGYGNAIGTNINVPLIETASNKTYGEVMKKIITPAVSRFRPEIIVISAGYDTHYSDPVGNMGVDSRTYWAFGRLVDGLVSKYNMKGSLWVLEGGYNPFALGPSIEATIIGLENGEQPRLQDQADLSIDRNVYEMNHEVIEKVYETISPYW